jgi:hypothetical protein
MLSRIIRLLVASLALAALLPGRAVAAEPRASGPRISASSTHYLIADFDNNRVIEIDAAGEIVWRYGEPATKTSVVKAPTRAFRLANGNTMILDNDKIEVSPEFEGRVIEVSPGGTIVKQVTGLFQATDVQVLANGNWLISELSRFRRRVIEVAPGTAVTDSTPFVYKGGPTGGSTVGVFSAQRLSSGNTLISDHGNNKVVEIDASGNTVCQVTGLQAPTRVTEVAGSGNWLIPLKEAYRVIEVQRCTGTVVWQFTTGQNSGNPNRTKFFLSSAERLGNGNTLIADGENNRVIEVNAAGAIVRTLPNVSGDTGSLGGNSTTCSANDLTRYGCPRDAVMIVDSTAPAVSSVSGVPASSTVQRIMATVTATDPSTSGEFTSGVRTYEYSLDGSTFATALTITPAAAPGAKTLDIDLANPAAGGSFTSGLKTLYLRVKDAFGNVSATYSPAPTVLLAVGTTVTRYLAEGYTGGSFDQYLTLANPSTSLTIYVAVTFQYAGGSSGPLGIVIAIAPNQRQTVKVDDVVGSGKELSLKLQSDQPFFAERPMYFQNYSTAGVAYNQPRASALSGINGGHLGVAAVDAAADWYFAEGYTGPGFEGYFTIQNPQTSDSAVQITYYYPDGTSEQKNITVEDGQRKTVVIHNAADAGGIGPNKTFSAKVSTTNGRNIIVERVQYFRYASPGGFGAGITAGVTGGTATLGATARSQTWYFAEGYTGAGFDQYVTIQNPNASAGTATLTYYIAGQNPEARSVPLLPNSRTTVRVHDAASSDNPGGLGRGYANSLALTADLPVVAERPVYFLYNGTPGVTSIDGGHNVMGATSRIAAGQSVVMAEGYTGGGFNQYLTFQNPNGSDVTVTVTYLTAAGVAIPKTVTLPANQRTTVAVHNASDPTGAGLGTDYAFSTKISVPAGAAGSILAERVMYFNYSNGATGGTAAFGVGSS